LIDIVAGAKNAKADMRCDSLILDQESTVESFPAIKVNEGTASVTHEATISRIDEEKLYYLQSRGLSEDQAKNLIILGFIEPFTSQLPPESSMELKRFIEIQQA
jgi:Fe-S cluster assembly protein SufB